MLQEEKPKRFMEVVRERIRLRHLSYTTEKHYLSWIHPFIIFYGKRYPKDMGEEEIERFLSHLAIIRNVRLALRTKRLTPWCFSFGASWGKTSVYSKASHGLAANVESPR